MNRSKSAFVSIIILYFLYSEVAYPLMNKQHKYKVELSIGTSLMFIEETDRLDIKEKSKVVIPTNAALFSINFNISSKWSVFSMLNLPMESQKFIVNNQLHTEKSSLSLGIGPMYNVYKTSFNDINSFKVDLVIGPVVMGDSVANLKYSLTSAFRFHVSNPNGFSMYIGLAKTVGIAGAVLWYGVGQKF